MAPKGGELGTITTNTMLIAETPPRGSITYKSGYASLTEPAPGNTVPYYFTIALDDISPVPVTVYYQTRDGSAKAGEDYRGVNSYRVTFPAFAHGATANSPPSQDVAITVNGDASDGINPETFAVVLTSAYNATINSASRSAIGTITQATPQPGDQGEHRGFQRGGPERGSDRVSCAHHLGWTRGTAAHGLLRHGGWHRDIGCRLCGPSQRTCNNRGGGHQR